MKKIKVFAPATVANVAVGFDLMGFPIEGIGDEITFEKTDRKQKVEIFEINSEFTNDPEQNTATIGIKKLLKDTQAGFGIAVRIKKGIPVGSGLGGSAASAVAGAFGANYFLIKKLKPAQIFKYAMLGEQSASGSAHPDNVAPCLLGGFIYTHTINPFEYFRFSIPSNIFVSVLHPHVKIETRQARAILKPDLPLKTFVAQNKNLLGFMLGLQSKNTKLLCDSVQDLVVEPQRAELIPRFREMKKSAFQSKALAFSISGSGPSVFAFSIGYNNAKNVLKAMESAYSDPGCEGWISPISKKGARFL